MTTDKDHYICAKNQTLELMQKTLEKFEKNQQIIITWMKQQDEKLAEGNKKFKRFGDALKDREYKNGHQDRDIKEEKERTLKIESRLEQRIDYLEKNYATKADFDNIYQQNLNIGKNIYIVIGFMVTILIAISGYAFTRLI